MNKSTDQVDEKYTIFMNNSEKAKSQLKWKKVNNTGGSTEIIK